MPDPTPPSPPPGESLPARADRLRQAFRAEFGGTPDGVWGAPGRVNLIGEHTDYNEGLALPMGIQQQALVAVRRRTDSALRLVSLQADRREHDLAELAPGRISGWAAYVAGAIWAALEDGATGTGLDLLLDSDVPMGAGLSSSAAVECASLLAIAELWGHERSRLDLARLAQRAEAEMAGVPCGLMDQLTAMCARSGHALAVDFRSLEIEPVALPLADAELALLVVDTRAPRRLADGAYAGRRQSCRDAAGALGVPSLRDATPEQLAALGPGSPERRRARHVITENERVSRALRLLQDGRGPAGAGAAARLHELGHLLSSSHASLRDDFEVSVPRLDVAAETAEHAGALGARMVGGGFGGSVLALLPCPAIGAVTQAVSAAFRARGWQEPRCFSAVPGNGAERLS